MIAVHRNPTQAAVILDYLSAGKELTALDALERFGCFRLAARIHELRKDGWEIEEKTVTGSNGKRYASYHLNTFKLQYA